MHFCACNSLYVCVPYMQAEGGHYRYTQNEKNVSKFYCVFIVSYSYNNKSRDKATYNMCVFHYRS